MQHLARLLLRIFCCIFDDTLTGYIANRHLVRLLLILLYVVYNHIDDDITIGKLISHFDVLLGSSVHFRVIRRDFSNFGKELCFAQFGYLTFSDGIFKNLLISLACILLDGAGVVFRAILQLQ